MINDLIICIIHPKQYKKLTDKPLWKSLLYVVLLSFLSAIIITSAFQNKYKDFIMMIPENYDSKVPNFTIKDNQLQLENNEKVVIEKNNVAFIFDTSKTASASALDKYKQGIIFLENSFVIKSSKYQKSTMFYKNLNLEGTDKKNFRNNLGSIPTLAIEANIGFIIFFILLNILVIFIFSIIFFGVNKFWKAKLRYVEIFKFSTYSITLSIILITLASILLNNILSLTNYGYAYYIMPIYLFIAVRFYKISSSRAHNVVKQTNKTVPSKKAAIKNKNSRKK